MQTTVPAASPRTERSRIAEWREGVGTIYMVDGQPVHAVQQGLPTRQMALLLHGWSSSWFAMSPLLPLMAQRFNCLAVDLPGYGASPPLPQRASIPAYADLLARLVEQVSSGPVVLVGHSMGGMISMTLALRHPVLVERMVLSCPTISGRLSTFINLFISPVTLLERFGLTGLLVSAVEWAYVGLTDRLMRPASFAERTGITEADYRRLRADARRPGQGRARAECFFAMRDNNLIGQLAQIEPPSLVLWGAEDNTVPLRDAGVVADEWPNADLRIIPKAGRWPHFETPDRSDMFVVQDGTVEVWSDPENVGAPQNLRHVASLTPGQITGELAMLDGGLRSADLRAGPDGATILTLDRERLMALAEDDPTLGTRVLWNIATAMALRVRFILWQLQRALQRAGR